MKYFVTDYKIKDMKPYMEFCLNCGVRTDIRDMDIIYEFHAECWKWYRQNNIPYKPPKWYGG